MHSEIVFFFCLLQSFLMYMNYHHTLDFLCVPYKHASLNLLPISIYRLQYIYEHRQVISEILLNLDSFQ